MIVHKRQHTCFNGILLSNASGCCIIGFPATRARLERGGAREKREDNGREGENGLGRELHVCCGFGRWGYWLLVIR